MAIDYCLNEMDSSGSYMQQDLAVEDTVGLLFQDEMYYVCLSQCANVCTLLKDVSVCTGMSVTLCMHMYEYVCIRATVSKGAKWASTESRKERKKTVLMTHLSHTTRWRKKREHVPLQR